MLKNYSRANRQPIADSRCCPLKGRLYNKSACIRGRARYDNEPATAAFLA